MSELTAEEQALLAETRPRRGRPPRRVEPEPTPVEPAPPAAQVAVEVRDRGPHTPDQYDDDGWGDLPVQMRG